MAFERRDHAVVPAPGTLRGSGVSPLQRGVASLEEERRRTQKGRRYRQATERAGGMIGQTKGSDPIFHRSEERVKKKKVYESCKTVYGEIIKVFWTSLSDWCLCNAPAP